MSPTSNRLESLAATHSKSPADVLEFWLERASIREYCGGQSRQAAELAAMADVEQWLEGK
jgi:hypothetical protein